MDAGARLARLGTSLGDVLMAGALTGLALFDVNAETVTHVWAARLATVLAVMSLAWRRRAPIPTLFAVCVLNLGLSATAPGEFPPQMVLLAVLVAVASAATNLGAPQDVWIAGLGSLALMWAAHAATGDGDVLDFLPFVLWVGPWAAGRLVRRRTLEVSRLAAESALLGEQREAAAREAVARERDSIARELHDVVAHSVSLMVIQAGAERLALGGEHPRTTAALEAIESTGREALQELRAMLAVLRNPSPPDGQRHTEPPQPTLGDIPALVGRVREAGLPVELSQPDTLPEVPPGAGLAAFRLVQESLTNALKHAPGPTRVSLQVHDDTLLIDVRNACPAPSPPQQIGRGVVGMRERVLLHGGHLEVGPEAGHWVVRARLPLGSRTAVAL